jgi:hypothetical protein
MAYVHSRETTHDVTDVVVRQGKRFVAIGGYAAAVAVAFVLLAPVLPGRSGGETAAIPSGPKPVLYTAEPGETVADIAASHGISLARLFTLNPALNPFTDAGGQPVVIGLR